MKSWNMWQWIPCESINRGVTNVNCVKQQSKDWLKMQEDGGKPPKGASSK